MPDCAVCPRIYKLDCRDFCNAHKAEVAAFKEAGNEHVQKLFMQIMYPYARGANV